MIVTIVTYMLICLTICKCVCGVNDIGRWIHKVWMIFTAERITTLGILRYRVLTTFEIFYVHISNYGQLWNFFIELKDFKVFFWMDQVFVSPCYFVVRRIRKGVVWPRCKIFTISCHCFTQLHLQQKQIDFADLSAKFHRLNFFSFSI